MNRAALIGLAATVLAGCGSTGGLGSSAPAGPALFVSPFGEPFTAAPGEPWPTAKWFAGADADGDGALTRDEFNADGRRYFAKLDINADGAIGNTEIIAYEEVFAGFSRGGGLGGRGGRSGPAPRLGVASGQESGAEGIIIRKPGRPTRPTSYGPVADGGFFNLPQPVKSADANGDRRITAAEWAETADRRFRALDTDGDGRLTLASLPRTPLQRQSGR